MSARIFCTSPKRERGPRWRFGLVQKSAILPFEKRVRRGRGLFVVVVVKRGQVLANAAACQAEEIFPGSDVLVHVRAVAVAVAQQAIQSAERATGCVKVAGGIGNGDRKSVV